MHVAHNNHSRGPKPPGQGPSQAELVLIQGIAAELCIALPGLSQEDAIHFAVESVKEQPHVASAVARMVAEIKQGNALWLQVTIHKTTSSPIEMGNKPEVVAVFQGPTRPSPKNTSMQIVGAAVARSLSTSAYARALLYASGMRITFKVDKSPLSLVEKG